MGFKDLFNQAKQKVKETIDKGNHELKKHSATVKMSIYSKPVLGAFVSKQVFKEESSLLIAVEDIKEDVFLHTIFKLEEDEEVYVVTGILEEEQTKEVVVNEKVFTYPCYTLQYRLLSDVFTEETFGLPYQELTEAKHDILNKMQAEIQGKSFAATEKKEAISKLWQYFTECITYQLKDHYVLDTFVKIADDYVTDFSSLLLKLFA